MITKQEALEAVEKFDVLVYFDKVTPGARLQIAEELMDMVNWPSDRVLRNGYGPIPYIEPRVRLDRLVNLMVKRVGTWPGVAEMRGLYCKMYKPADGIEVSICNIPGFTDEECENGVDYLSIDRARKEPKFIPAPDDEPIGEDFKRQIAKAAKTLGR